MVIVDLFAGDGVDVASLGLFKIDRIHYSMFDVERSMLTVRRRRIH